jgi:tetratricopeptide (TPR) repeat protein
LEEVQAIDRDKRLAQAQKYILKGQLRKAVDEYKKLIEANPKDKRLYLKIGDLYAKEGDNGKAIKEYFKVADLYAGEDLNLWAIAIYKKVLALDPKLLEAHHKIAELYYREGLIGSAKSYYDAALRIRPGDQEALNGLKRIEGRAKGEEEPIATEAFEPHPYKPSPIPESPRGSEEIPLSLGPPLDLPEVQQDGDLSLVDKDSEMHYHLGIAYKEMELFDYAISEFETASANQAIKFDCCIMLGDCYMEKGHHERSIEYYKMAAEITGLSDEKMARLHFNLGLAYEANGMTSEALDAFKAVLKFNQSAPEAQEKIRKLQGIHPSRSMEKS